MLVSTAVGDFLIGGTGDDNYFVNDGGDRAVENAGRGFDRVSASVSWVLGAGSEVEMLTTTDNLG